LDAYQTIVTKGTGLYKSKGSKFFSYAYHIKSESDVKEVLETIGKEHFKARHICYAYRLSIDGSIYRANDDGEPSGTAGLPILNVLKSKSLVKSMIAVVRYFGGTKLGISGLIQAYKTSASEAVDNAAIREEFIYDEMTFTFPYDDLGTLMNCIAKSGIVILEQFYEQEPIIKVAIRQSEKEGVLLAIYSQLFGYEIADLNKIKDHPVKVKKTGIYEGLL